MNRAQVGSEGFGGFGGVRRGSDPNPCLYHLCANAVRGHISSVGIEVSIQDPADISRR